MLQPNHAPLENYLASPDRGLESDILDDKLLGIKLALGGWCLKQAEITDDATGDAQYRREQDDFCKWLTDELRDFFWELKAASSGCEYTVGNTDAQVHHLKSLGDEHALYGPARILSGSKYNLDYAELHTVPQGSNFDDAPGSSESRQLYLGDRRSQMAISLNQLAISLIDGGDLELKR